MSLLRATFRPLANLSTAQVRAFSTTRVAHQSVNSTNLGPFSLRNQPTGVDSESRNRWSRSRPAEFPDENASETDKSWTYAQELLNRERIAQDTEHRNKSNFMTRLGKWKVGDIYAPHDLTGVETAKWRRRGVATPTSDAFDTLALDPLKEYKNFSILSNYTSEYGRIKHRRVTGLRPKNQRKLAKAIRRSIGLGIMPSVHAHPESIWNTSKIATDRF
ncbi:ribosomal protein S18 [Phyllosticta citrichinensis]|uniref:Small ribosomal subunit protein bS18m n=1 Tax=Phyllosticta citrichinensis TaxID=1130410 RepID=A0ABR1XHP4_9PEZI